MPFYPHTTQSVTHSFQERQLTAEFDDALVDQIHWKNARYDGSRLKGKKINYYHASSSTWEGDQTYQTEPVLNNQTTALYIANSVIGGTEDPQYATIKNHSYVSISKILIINLIDSSVQLIDRTTEPYEEFHRFITNDFPTGNKAYLRIIDPSTPTIGLKPHHRVKMNKGLLLKTFRYNHPENEFAPFGTASASFPPNTLSENNSLYLYKSGSFKDNFVITGSIAAGSLTETVQRNQLRFRYGVLEMWPGSTAGNETECHNSWSMDRVGPSYASASIYENEFTQNYYSGAYGVINNHPDITDLSAGGPGRQLAASGLGSASRFLGIDSLKYLTDNIADTALSEQEKTEIHITFFEGTKDFAPGWHDERSISTFEVDQNQAVLYIEAGDDCNQGLPTNHELLFKGPQDNRFIPTLGTFDDDIANMHIMSTASSTIGGSGTAGCTPVGGYDTQNTIGDFMWPGATVDRIEDIECYVQGGALGPVGFEGAQSASVGSYGNSQLDNMTSDNFYSGSFNWEMSFLKKDHVLILDLDKNAELQQSIGNDGLCLIPQNSIPEVGFNIEYWLQKAGIISSTVPIPQPTQYPGPAGATP
tara:strand:- start:3334 stop:5103 length:1770 start_codon:yes stop_codon:yes gene_type:complete